MLLNCPAAHAVQFVPPGVAKVSVTHPALHRVHATVDAELNCPAVHAVHRVALVDDSAFVTHPCEHSAHAEVDRLL